MKNTVIALSVLLAAAGCMPAAVFSQGITEIEIVFDSSRSMNERMGNQTKLDAAKQSLAGLAQQIPPGANVGLRAFGTAPVKGDIRESCFDSQLMIPIKGYDPMAMTARVQAFQANGQTPLGHSLELAAKDFTNSPDVKKSIILVSDGEESCGKDPVAVVKNLKAQGIEVKVHAIGFAVDERTRAQLRQISEITGGTYQDAQDAGQLKKSLEEAVEKEMLLKAERGKGENLLAATAGARIVFSNNEDVAYAIDGSERTYAYLKPGEQVVLSFKDNQPVLIESFAIPIAQVESSNPRQIGLSGSVESPHSGFFPIGTATFKNRVDFQDVYQHYKIDPPAAVRYLKITGGPSFASGDAAHYEWRAHGKYLSDEEFKTHLAKQDEVERNLIAKDAGGRLVAASAEGFEVLIDGSGQQAGQEDVTIEPGQEMIFGFAGDKEATVTKFAVPVFESSETNCKAFEISVSTESPTSGFTSVGAFETTNMLMAGQPFQEFRFSQPLRAKYVKIKVLSAHGSDYCYLREIQLFGNFSAPAAASASSGPSAPAAPPADGPGPAEPQKAGNPDSAKTDDQVVDSAPPEEAPVSEAEDDDGAGEE